MPAPRVRGPHVVPNAVTRRVHPFPRGARVRHGYCNPVLPRPRCLDLFVDLPLAGYGLDLVAVVPGDAVRTSGIECGQNVRREVPGLRQGR